MDKNLIQSRDNIIESAGRTTQGFGFGRIIGQLYALLFFSPEPLSLDDMAGELKVSKGSVSTNIRELEKWGAVKQIWIKGSRKDYYLVEVDFMRIIREGIIPIFKQKLNSSLVAANESRQLLKSGSENFKDADQSIAQFYEKRLALIEAAQKKVKLLLNFPGL